MSRGCSGGRDRLRAGRAGGRAAPALRAGACGRRAPAGWRRAVDARAASRARRGAARRARAGRAGPVQQRSRDRARRTARCSNARMHDSRRRTARATKSRPAAPVGEQRIGFVVAVPPGRRRRRAGARAPVAGRPTSRAPAREVEMQRARARRRWRSRAARRARRSGRRRRTRAAARRGGASRLASKRAGTRPGAARDARGPRPAPPQLGLPVVAAWRAPPDPSAAASRGARPGISRRPPPARRRATRPRGSPSRSAGSERARAPRGGRAQFAQQVPAQRRVEAIARRAPGTFASSARPTNSPGARKRRLAAMPWRSASVFCSQRRIAGCGIRTCRARSGARRGVAQFLRQQPGEHFEVVAVVEAEVGRAASRQDGGSCRNGRDSRDVAVRWAGADRQRRRGGQAVPIKHSAPNQPLRGFRPNTPRSARPTPRPSSDSPTPASTRRAHHAARIELTVTARQQHRRAGPVGQRQVDAAGGAHRRAARRPRARSEVLGEPLPRSVRALLGCAGASACCCRATAC